MEEGTNSAATLAARYSTAFAAYLADPGERLLGAAYDLGREAVAAHLSILDIAEAHHGALRRHAGGADSTTLEAAASFLRESLSTFETVHRGYHEVQEVARLEHEHVEQLRTLADASVAINSSATVEEILQLSADTARGILRTTRATVAIYPPDPRLRPLTATSPPRLDDGQLSPSRLTARLTGRGRDLGLLEVVDRPERAYSARDEAILTQLAQLTSVAISNAQSYDRERTISRTLQHSLRPGALPDVSGLSAGVRFQPAGEVELGGDFYDLFAARDGGWAAVIGDVQGKGPDAAAVTALARHTMRAAAVYEDRPSDVLALLHRALREQRPGEGRFCTVAYAHLRVGFERIAVELACGGHPLPLVVHPDGRVQPVGRLGTLLGTDIPPNLVDVAVELGPADVLVLYTDGVTEVRRRHREVFGHKELVALLQTCAGLPPDAVADRVSQAVLEASVGHLRDDMAIVALGPTPQPKESDG
jgi:serine phosphatase RsbU (regulator of sigma subunit)